MWLSSVLHRACRKRESFVNTSLHSTPIMAMAWHAIKWHGSRLPACSNELAGRVVAFHLSELVQVVK